MPDLFDDFDVRVKIARQACDRIDSLRERVDLRIEAIETRMAAAEAHLTGQIAIGSRDRTWQANQPATRGHACSIAAQRHNEDDGAEEGFHASLEASGA